MIRMIAACVSALRRLEHLDDLRLDRHVERRRRLVGDQDARVVGDRHRDHRALAHAAGELVRVLIDAPLGEGHADQLEQLDRPRTCVVVAHAGRCAPGRPPPIWLPIVSTGFSEVIGSWKIIAISPPRISPQLALRAS